MSTPESLDPKLIDSLMSQLAPDSLQPEQPAPHADRESKTVSYAIAVRLLKERRYSDAISMLDQLMVETDDVVHLIPVSTSRYNGLR